MSLMSRSCSHSCCVKAAASAAASSRAAAARCRGRQLGGWRMVGRNGGMDGALASTDSGASLASAAVASGMTGRPA